MTAFDNSDFRKEAKEKWGQTQAYKEYEEKQHSQQKQDALAAEMDHIMAEFAACMEKGAAPDSAQAQSLVKRLQEHITENYYHCTNQILEGPRRLPCPWDFPSKNTGVGCHFLLQGIFPTQGSNLNLLDW